MCGRARCTLRADDVSRACYRNHGQVRTVNMHRYRPSYNVAPGANLPVVRRVDGSDGEDEVVIECMKWGLIPSFTKKTEKPDHYRMFNARSESICEKASFRRLIPKSRCVVAVEGFYEWKKDGSKKQPYYVHFKDGQPLLFAALYDHWENNEGEKLYTFSIITTSSSPALGWLHDRMPVILGDKESIDTWLNGSSSSNFDKLLKPYEGSDLVWYPVTPAMGKVSFDGPECSNEIQLKTESTNPITKFFSTKGTKKEELNSKDTNYDDSSVKTDLAESIKKEPEYKDDGVQLFSTVKCEQDPKSSISTFSQEDASSAEGTNSITEFFSMKGTKKEKLNSEDTSSHDLSVKTDLQESVKKEPEYKEDHEWPSSTVKCEEDSKSSVSTFSQEGASKGQRKRDYKEFSADSKLVHSKADKMSSSNPAKKKANLKTAQDKQPTLFSYFGKS